MIHSTRMQGKFFSLRLKMPRRLIIQLWKVNVITLWDLFVRAWNSMEMQSAISRKIWLYVRKKRILMD